MADGRIKLEVAVSRVEDAITAERAGADRVEVSGALELGGLTPSLGLLGRIRGICRMPIIAMLRPRAGGFVYSQNEFETMQADAEAALGGLADGLAFGILNSDRTIDVQRCKKLVDLIGKTESVFHRAFDLVRDPLESLEQLIDLGFKRVLTSGQARSALEGAALLRKLVEIADGRIEILPAAGIRAENVAEVIARTHCEQVHGTFSTMKADPAGVVDEGQYLVTDAQQLARVRETIDKIN